MKEFFKKIFKTNKPEKEEKITIDYSEFQKYPLSDKRIRKIFTLEDLIEDYKKTKYELSVKEANLGYKQLQIKYDRLYKLLNEKKLELAKENIKNEKYNNEYINKYIIDLFKYEEEKDND